MKKKYIQNVFYVLNYFVWLTLFPRCSREVVAKNIFLSFLDDERDEPMRLVFCTRWKNFDWINKSKLFMASAQALLCEPIDVHDILHGKLLINL